MCYWHVQHTFGEQACRYGKRNRDACGHAHNCGELVFALSVSLLLVGTPVITVSIIQIQACLVSNVVSTAVRIMMCS